MLHVATRTILGGRDPAKMKKRESSYFIFVFALMINFKFFACEPRVYYPLRNPYYIDCGACRAKRGRGAHLPFKCVV